MIRIGFDARYINDRYHGIGRYAFRLLEALVQAGIQYNFTIFLGKDIESRFDWQWLKKQPNVSFQKGPWPMYWPHEQIIWPNILKRSRVDLFHSPYFVAPLFTWKSPPSVVITVHDLIFDRFPEYMPKAWSRPYYRLLMSRSARRANRIVAVSRSTASDLAQYYPISAGKITVIPEGVETSFHPVSDNSVINQIRQKYHLRNPFILAVGARRPHKNMGRLVQAFANLTSDIPHDLVFIGPGDSRFPDEARYFSSVHSLNGRARFLDWVPECDLATLYSMADMLVVPSLIEGFGLPALEAMACGTPVLAANRSSLPEVIGKAGLLVDPLSVVDLTQAIYRILMDVNLSSKMVKTGLERSSTFSWSQTAKLTLQAYQDIL